MHVRGGEVILHAGESTNYRGLFPNVKKGGKGGRGSRGVSRNSFPNERIEEEKGDGHGVPHRGKKTSEARGCIGESGVGIFKKMNMVRGNEGSGGLLLGSARGEKKEKLKMLVVRPESVRPVRNGAIWWVQKSARKDSQSTGRTAIVW